MLKPVVSVVIPTYNNPGLLMETLGSVFAQTFGDYEVVVVNDGSTDETGERLRELGSRVRVIEQSNQGIGAARNRGIEEARGKYVALLDHDDLWMPGKLAAQVGYMEGNRGLVGCSVRYAFSTARGVPAYRFEEAVGVGGVVERPLRWLAAGCVFLITSGLMFDQERAAGLRYTTRRGCIEDVPFQVGLLARGEFGMAGEGVLMEYRLHEQNSSKEAGYFYEGIKMLREMDRRGELPVRRAEERGDLLGYLGYIGRMAVAGQLRVGERGKAWEVYCSEFGAQVRLGRWSYLGKSVVGMLLPGSVMRKVGGGGG